jgi:hypothetical protein
MCGESGKLRIRECSRSTSGRKLVSPGLAPWVLGKLLVRTTMRPSDCRLFRHQPSSILM